MKNKYVFVNTNNGHCETYHPFETDAVLTQEKVTQLILENNPNAERIGSTLSNLLWALQEHGFKVNILTCPLCNHEVEEINKPLPQEWEMFYGVTGNY